MLGERGAARKCCSTGVREKPCDVARSGGGARAREAAGSLPHSSSTSASAHNKAQTQLCANGRNDRYASHRSLLLNLSLNKLNAVYSRLGQPREFVGDSITYPLKHRVPRDGCRVFAAKISYQTSPKKYKSLGLGILASSFDGMPEFTGIMASRR